MHFCAVLPDFRASCADERRAAPSSPGKIRGIDQGIHQAGRIAGSSPAMMFCELIATATPSGQG
jgi:hypothetical protein